MKPKLLTVTRRFLIGSAVLFTLSCNLSLQNQPPEFSNIFGWATSNIDPSYWTKGGGSPHPATAFRLFQVFVDDPDGNDDIVKIIVTHPNGLVEWHIEEHYQSDGGYWGGWGYYDDTETDSLHKVDLGTYTVSVRDSADHGVPFAHRSGAWSTQRSELPVSLDTYAIIVPSGDQQGHEIPGPRTRGVSLSESKDISHRIDWVESWEVKSKHLPSGEHRG